MINSGWVRSTREKQGLKGFQLAEKLGVSPARVSVLEKDEMRGAVTLKMMERVAKAMGCRFEYRIVPVNERLDTGPEKNSKPRYRVV